MLVAFDRENSGWKTVYDFLDIDREIYLLHSITFDQNIRIVYSNIRAVYPNKTHVTTHPEYPVDWVSICRSRQKQKGF